jgi:hypothetical protein
MSARPHNRPGKFLKAAQQPGAHKPFQLWSTVVFHLIESAASQHAQKGQQIAFSSTLNIAS